MLNYRNTVILFFIVLTGFVVAVIYVPANIALYIGTGIAFLSLLIAGSISIRQGFYVRSYWAGDRKVKKVAISFDDGPDSNYTPVVLDLLKQQGIQAAFFVVGNKVEMNREIIRRIDQEGHILGGHSYSHHFFFDLFPAHQMNNELELTENLVMKITGKRMRWFRPPYGVTNPVLAREVRKLGYHVIGWSLKSKDTVIVDSQELLERLQKKIRSGDLILFHDTKPVLLKVLPSFIDFLKSERYQIVRPDQLLNLEAYE
jgi:peptidoglycan-N-acetylglucosamine deacetylase